MSSPAAVPTPDSRWQRLAAASVRAFHAYAGWLVGISWWRFALLSLLLLIVSAILQHLPPFSWKISQTVVADEAPKPTRTKSATVTIDTDKPGSSSKHNEAYEITIDKSGVRITPRTPSASAAASAGEAPPVPPAIPAPPVPPVPPVAPSVDIRLPPGATSEAVREAVEEARRSIVEAIEDAREEARAEADAAREAAQAAAEAGGKRTRLQTTHLGDFLPELAFLWIIMSGVIKITYKRQIQAEAQAAQATETAEAESLKRQVVEARMAAMQAQVEPHFLFNTLASIDHLIETDPARASTMQKNLIALLRASMPTLREAGDGGPRDLRRELDVIRPYLEILKVRMEDRLRTEIDVPEGLLSAEFPSMMIQTLVENAIKHGLEPKPEGGLLGVRAEVLHGKLAVTVADTGVGFGKAATAGTGVGLANVRERLRLLYGNKATLNVRENNGGGTAVTITVPYKSIDDGTAAPA